MITFHNVKKSFDAPGGTRTVLRRTSFVVPTGSRLGIIGSKGCGKSTVIKLMAGLELADSGRITRSGRVSLPLGFPGGLQVQLTGAQNCRFVAQIYGCDATEVCEFVKEFADLGSYFDVPLSRYGSVQRSRLAYGIAMAIQFDTYLADSSPLIGEEDFRARCEELLSYRLENSDIVLATDNRDILRQYCDSGAVLWNGQIEFFSSIDEAWGVYEELIRRNPTARGGRQYE